MGADYQSSAPFLRPPGYNVDDEQRATAQAAADRMVEGARANKIDAKRKRGDEVKNEKNLDRSIGDAADQLRHDMGIDEPEGEAAAAEARAQIAFAAQRYTAARREREDRIEAAEAALEREESVATRIRHRGNAAPHQPAPGAEAAAAPASVVAVADNAPGRMVTLRCSDGEVQFTVSASAHALMCVAQLL